MEKQKEKIFCQMLPLEETIALTTCARTRDILKCPQIVAHKGLLEAKFWQPQAVGTLLISRPAVCDHRVYIERFKNKLKWYM